MAGKRRRVRSRATPLPPPPPQQSSTSGDSGSDDNKEEEGAAAGCPSPNGAAKPSTPPPAAAAAVADTEAVEESDADMGVNSSSRSPTKTARVQEDTEGSRSFGELQTLYPCLAAFVERIKGQSSCGEVLVRAFGLIGDRKANALESKIKAQRISQVKSKIRQEELKLKVQKLLISLVE